MVYTPLPVTEKILKIREEYLKSPVAVEDNMYQNMLKNKRAYTGDRWLTLGFLEGWLKHQNAPTTFRRRALAEAEELYAWEPIITENELITGQPDLHDYTPDEQLRYNELYEMFHMSPITCHEKMPRVNHLSLDLEKLLKVGINGIIDSIEQKISELNLNNRAEYPTFENIEKYDFYQSCLIELNALLDLSKRYSKKASELAKNASETRSSELLRISKALENVPQNPAKSFFEALQSIQFFLGTLFGLYPLNRPDRYLYSYYKKDLADGTITRAEAQELIDNFLLSVSTRVYSRAACGFIVGGEDANGNIIENDLTYMFLTALDHIQLPDPNGALAVSPKTSDDILRYSAKILSRGTTHPAFYNDRAIVDSLLKYGCTREDAVEFIHTTCAEISVVGKSRSHTTPFTVSLPKILHNAVLECSNEDSFARIQESFVNLIEKELKNGSFNYLIRMLEAKRNAHEPVRVCCFVDDCIERGKSIWDGGERYCFIQPIFVGLGTTIDSLAAIQHVVFDKKILTLSEFLKIVEDDFAENEYLRQYIINKCPHYGNDDQEVDKYADWLASELRKILSSPDLLAGDFMMPGTFTYDLHVISGKTGKASFDGRHAKTSYSDGCGPVQGRNIHGPTATILSLTSWEQSDFLAGMVINMKYSPKHLTECYLDEFVTLLRTFISNGGIEMQVNVVDRATLIDAQINPDAHRDLIVRIGGYSDYFIRLDKVMQDEIIERSEY